MITHNVRLRGYGAPVGPNRISTPIEPLDRSNPDIVRVDLQVISPNGYILTVFDITAWWHYDEDQVRKLTGMVQATIVLACRVVREDLQADLRGLLGIPDVDL